MPIDRTWVAVGSAVAMALLVLDFLDLHRRPSDLVRPLVAGTLLTAAAIATMIAFF